MTGAQRERVEPWAGSRLPNNNKKHLCVIDQAVRGRWRARRGQIDRNPLWSPHLSQRPSVALQGTKRGRQMAQRRESRQKEMKEGHKESKKPKKECEWRGIDYERMSPWAQPCQWTHTSFFSFHFIVSLTGRFSSPVLSHFCCFGFHFCIHTGIHKAGRCVSPGRFCSLLWSVWWSIFLALYTHETMKPQILLLLYTKILRIHKNSQNLLAAPANTRTAVKTWIFA